MTNWNDYAETYDLMATETPAYQDLLQCFREEFGRWPLADGDTVLEVGAGTGNFTIEAAKLFPGVSIIHSEPEPVMQRRAIEKLNREGVSNIKVMSASADELPFTEQSLKAVILVHVLYTLPNPISFLEKLHGWLGNGGLIFACDLGRVMDIADWRSYFWRELVQKDGYRKAAQKMWKARGIFQANKKIADAQRAGQYWTHTGEEFAEAFRSVGFTVERQELVYRGYSNLVVARKEA